MAFPLSLSGEIEVPGARDPLLNATAIAASVEGAIRPRSILREGTVVDFKGGMLRLVSSINILAPITSGHVDVRSGPSGVRIYYTLRFTECLIACAAIAVLFGTVGFLQLQDYFRPHHVPILFPVLCVALPFIWLFGGNVAVTLFRFPRLLRNAATVMNAG
jgi:hypothetical protein